MDKCQICGALREPLHSNCAYCGTAYSAKEVTGETYINALRTILGSIDQQDYAKAQSAGAMLAESLVQGQSKATTAKVSAISTFAMPADVENLLQFLAFCHGNAQVAVLPGDRNGDALRSAWNGKARMAFSQLKIKSVSNPNLAAVLADYESLYGINVRPMQSAQAIAAKKGGLIAVAGFIVMAAIIGPLAMKEGQEEAAEKARIEAVTQKVQSLINAGQLDQAEAAAADIQWTWNLNLTKSQELAKSYDEKRQTLLNLISQARSRPQQ